MYPGVFIRKKMIYMSDTMTKLQFTCTLKDTIFIDNSGVAMYEAINVHTKKMT